MNKQSKRLINNQNAKLGNAIRWPYANNERGN